MASTWREPTRQWRKDATRKRRYIHKPKLIKHLNLTVTVTGEPSPEFLDRMRLCGVRVKTESG